jgi:sarcosine oxidase subunit gamma
VPEAALPQTALGRSAFDPRDVRPRGVRVAERSRLGKIDLRGNPHARGFMAAAGRALDLLLPSEPCTSAARDQIGAIWLGPDQWLVTCPARDVPGLLESLREALAGVHAAITDVTDGRVAFRLAGPSARDVLAKGCPLDLHPRAFPPGRCAQTLLAKASVLIHLVDDTAEGGANFDVYVGRSFAHYLWAWLEDAGREYGVLIEPPA